MAIVRSRRYCDNPRCEYYHKQRGDGSFCFQTNTVPARRVDCTRWGEKGEMNLCSLCAEIVTKATGLDPIPESFVP